MSVSLSTGQSIRLDHADGEGGPPVIRLDLDWQATPRRGMFGWRRREVDLDASAVLFADGVLTDVVFFQHLVSNDGSVRHTGESESITVDLGRVPDRITRIVFTVNSYNGQSFAELQHFHCELVDESTGAELARFTLSGGGEHRGQVLAKVGRDEGGAWELTAIGVPTHGQTFREMLPVIEKHL
ncbi:TerD family protein [Streptacidiphilus neutrinimicus]|uniref:TerD family protein n=1 Tax=Streptacidiphilus neutrinimicus TaxID=105420 RepID=UPI0005AB037B|nr:TerD family protein [Streptacidiphilus neutrinimicus]